MRRQYILIFSFFNLLILTGCSSMLETDSELVEYEKDNTLDHATDSVYSTMGIVNKMQVIADRVVLLGEVRGDLVVPTESASSDLKRLAAFNNKEANKYNAVSDYYAIINNCNYFLAHADTTLQRRGRQLLLSEYAAVKSFRAWTYLQLAQIYGRVPLVLSPVMTEQEAQDAMNQSYVDIVDICQYFISDLAPYVGVELPRLKTINNFDAAQFFIPMKALLGDLCLWAGRYQEAAQWYHDYLNDAKKPIHLSLSRSYWPNPSQYTTPIRGYDGNDNTEEVLCFIPMERNVFDGVVSDLPNIFNSTSQNNYYYQVKPSESMDSLSKAQIYCTEYQSATLIDTIYAPRTGLSSDLYIGDLRFCTNYRLSPLGGQSDYSEYNSFYQSIEKIWSSLVPLYRGTMIYLRYAEALNRVGLPQSALVVLKYGMCNDNVKLYVDAAERAKAGSLVDFDPAEFRRVDAAGNLAVRGVHSYGSGDAHANKYYVLPQPPTALATRQDTVDYQIPLVEDMIIDEMALEGAFEGNRYYDLMRVALRRNDPAYLADPISRREGSADAALRTLLMDKSNWYLPLP